MKSNLPQWNRMRDVRDEENGCWLEFNTAQETGGLRFHHDFISGCCKNIVRQEQYDGYAYKYLPHFKPP
jgi:hypothetical protein